MARQNTPVQTVTLSESALIKLLSRNEKKSNTRVYLLITGVSLIASLSLNFLGLPFLAHIAFLFVYMGAFSIISDFKFGCFSMGLKLITYPILFVMLAFWLLQAPFALLWGFIS